MFANIATRTYRFKPYGVALTKMVARLVGINPVWYVDVTTGAPLRIRTALNTLVTRACSDGFFDEVKDMFPAIEPMFTRTDSLGNVTSRNEWWWEREWRHVGDLDLASIWTKLLWLCPEAEIDDLEALVRAAGGDSGEPVYCIDPNWSLERIIGHLMRLARRFDAVRRAINHLRASAKKHKGEAIQALPRAARRCHVLGVATGCPLPGSQVAGSQSRFGASGSTLARMGVMAYLVAVGVVAFFVVWLVSGWRAVKRGELPEPRPKRKRYVMRGYGGGKNATSLHSRQAKAGKRIVYIPGVGYRHVQAGSQEAALMTVERGIKPRRPAAAQRRPA